MNTGDRQSSRMQYMVLVYPVRCVELKAKEQSLYPGYRTLRNHNA